MILDFAKWSKLYEQVTQAPTASKIDFVISAGASKKPMSDELLNANQGYPAPPNADSTATLYDISLTDAVNRNFSKATIVGQTTATERDQIIFENNSIMNAGKIAIEWNPTNAVKKIRVSGNGALVLARAANQFNENLKAKSGVIQLELSAPELYSKLWAIDQMGMTVSDLQSRLKGITYQVAVQTANPQLKPTLVKKWQDLRDLIETRYCPPIIETDSAGNQTAHQPNLEKNAALQANYDSYSLEDFVKSTGEAGEAIKKLRPTIKSMIIDPGMDKLSEYVDTYLNEKMVGLDPTYISRFASSIKSNIAQAKANFNLGEITTALRNAVTSSPAGALSLSPTQTTVKSTTYKEGESK